MSLVTHADRKGKRQRDVADLCLTTWLRRRGVRNCLQREAFSTLPDQLPWRRFQSVAGRAALAQCPPVTQRCRSNSESGTATAVLHSVYSSTCTGAPSREIVTRVPSHPPPTGW